MRSERGYAVIGQEGRLAVARRRRDNGDRHVGRLQPVNEAGTRHERPVGGRRMKLRLEKILRRAFTETGLDVVT